jgi:UPF0042 nucleotide-binding protein
MRRLVIVTGLSGAGKSQAMKSFEDLGFACLDNVPPVLAAPYVALVEESGRDRAAIALDVRSRGTFGDPLAALEALNSAHTKRSSAATAKPAGATPSATTPQP